MLGDNFPVIFFVSFRAKLENITDTTNQTKIHVNKLERREQGGLDREGTRKSTERNTCGKIEMEEERKKARIKNQDIFKCPFILK